MLIKHVQEHGGKVLSGLGEMLWTKSMFEPFREMWENRDYYGYNIYDENAPFYQQAWQTLRHVFGDLTPISLSSGQRALDTGGTWSKDYVLAVMGFGPAPAYAEKSAIQNRIAHLYNEHVAPKSRTFQEGEISQARMRARNHLLAALHTHDPEGIAKAREEARKAGYSATAINAIGRVPSDVYLFSRLPQADQEAILRQATPEEFERYIGHAEKKIRGPMREERAGSAAAAPAAPPPSRPTSIQAPPPAPPMPAPSTSAPRPAAPEMPPPPPRGRSRADDLLRTSPTAGK